MKFSYKKLIHLNHWANTIFILASEAFTRINACQFFRCVVPVWQLFHRDSSHVRYGPNALLSGHGPYQHFNAEKIARVDEPRRQKSPSGTGGANFRVILIYISI